MTGIFKAAARLASADSMSKLLWLTYEMCSVAWFTVGLAIVWAYPMVRVRYLSVLDGHALSWPATSRGAPSLVRLATAGALALAGLLLFVEPAIWPPLFGPRIGVAMSVVGVVEAYFLEGAARDVLRRSPQAHVAAISISIVLVISRLAIVLMFSWARVPAPAEQQLPLPLAVWPPIMRNGAWFLPSPSWGSAWWRAGPS